MATIPAALRPRLSRRATATLLIAALGVPLVAGAGWIAFSNGEGLGAMELAAYGNGKVTILRGTERITVNGTQDLQALDVIETAKGATARFNLEGDRSIEMAEKSGARILSAAAVEPLRGDILADTGDQLRLTFGDITATTSEALFRVDRSSSARTGVYTGTVHLSSPGQPDLDVLRLHEVDVPLAAPDLSRAAPYRLNASDVWDKKHLESVVALDKDLTQLAKGLSTQFAQARPSLGYYEDVAGQQVKFMKPFMDHRPSDLMLGLTVADAAPGSLSLAFESAFGLFDQGARWSVTAAIMKANVKDLRKGLDALIARSGLSGGDGSNGSLAGSVGGPGATGPNGAVNGDGPGSADGPGGGPTDDPTNPPGSDPTNPPGKDPKDPPVKPDPTPTNPPKECTSDIECAVNDVEELEPPVDNPLDQDIKDGTDVVNKKKSDGGLPGAP